MKLANIIGIDDHLLNTCSKQDKKQHHMLATMVLCFTMLSGFSTYFLIEKHDMGLLYKLIFSALASALILNLYKMYFVLMDLSLLIHKKTLTMGNLIRLVSFLVLSIYIATGISCYAFRGTINEIIEVFNVGPTSNKYLALQHNLELSVEDIRFLKMNTMLSTLKLLFLLNKTAGFWIYGLTATMAIIPFLMKITFQVFVKGEYKVKLYKCERLAISNDYLNTSLACQAIFKHKYNIAAKEYCLYEDPPFNTIKKPQDFNKIYYKKS